MEPPHSYVRVTSSSVVHHEDYLSGRGDQALCGAGLDDPALLGGTVSEDAVCADCEARLAEYHVKWWRERAEAATAELAELRVKYSELAERVEGQGAQAELTAQAGEVLSGEKAESLEESQADLTEARAEAAPTLLGQARKELVELCRGFEGAVPYWRLKNSMDAFSDKLTSDERVLLAQEIGADGSLIRWCTREIEDLGWQVTNNPVHGEADDMMDAWTHDLYQTPKKTKWRLGRSRSNGG